MTATHYELLEVPATADAATVRRAFMVQAKEWHPDKAPDAERASYEARFQRLSEAYETLSDPRRRARYDMELRGVREGRSRYATRTETYREYKVREEPTDPDTPPGGWPYDEGWTEADSRRANARQWSWTTETVGPAGQGVTRTIQNFGPLAFFGIFAWVLLMVLGVMLAVFGIVGAVVGGIGRLFGGGSRRRGAW
ncbi:MAG: J domain-containing protein [bacterium]